MAVKKQTATSQTEVTSGESATKKKAPAAFSFRTATSSPAASKPSPDLTSLPASCFTSRLLRWHQHENHRAMPWKGEKDPYKIWLSEIILQQTRVEQGLAYYEKFIRHYPDIAALASSPEDQVFKDWEGLGYYSRCKNLLITARTIIKDYKGKFPDQYDQILSLKGIGPYTAAAISAFAFNQPYAVLDGNVFRVLSRVYGIDTPTDSTKGKQLFQKLAQENLSKPHPALYNQAIMDFGATVCKPAAPLCGHCPMGDICQAKQTGRVMSLPVKEKMLQKKNRYISWIILALKPQVKGQKNEVNNNNYKEKSHSPSKNPAPCTRYYIQKRPAGDIWENLHEFYPIETQAIPDWSRDLTQLAPLLENLLDLPNKVSPGDLTAIASHTQQLTHQKIHGYFYQMTLQQRPAVFPLDHWYSMEDIQALAFPKLLKDIQFEAIEKQK